MGRNLLAETSITAAFAHFPDDPNSSIHSTAVQPVFEGLPAVDQEWVSEVVRKQQDPRDGRMIPALADTLGVSESVAIGLVILLHPDA